MTVLLQGVPIDTDLICPIAGVIAILILILGVVRFLRFREEIKPKPRGFEVILPQEESAGPYAPSLINVVTAALYPGGCTLSFDQPVALIPPPPLPPPTPDDAMTFDGQTANFITQFDAYTLYFNLAVPVNPGSIWAIARQPAWMATILAVPQGGVF